MRWSTRLVVALLVLGGAGAIAWGIMPHPVPVETSSVRTGPLTVRVTNEGMTRFRTKRRILAPIPGNVQKISLQAGDSVHMGQVVARITPTSSPLLDSRSRRQLLAQLQVALANVRQAEAAAAQAQVASQFAHKQLRRVEALARSGAVAQQQVDDARMEAEARDKQAEAARLAVTVARRQVGAIQASLSEASGKTDGKKGGGTLEVASPIDGVVLRVLYEDEGVVAPGTPLVEVGDPRSIEVVVDVLTRDAVRIHPGAEVEMDGWGGDKPLRGKVRRVEPGAFTKVSALGIAEQRVLVVVDPQGNQEQWRQLGDGFRVEAHIATWKGEHVVKVPSSALFRDHERWAVYVVRSGKARLQHVRIGHQTGTEAEVLEGVRQGEQVVLHPGDSVQDGVRVSQLPP